MVSYFICSDDTSLWQFYVTCFFFNSRVLKGKKEREEKKKKSQEINLNTINLKQYHFTSITPTRKCDFLYKENDNKW
jgi:hypothetical protein